MYNFYMILKQMLNYKILIEMKPSIIKSNVFSSVMKSIVVTGVR